MSSAALHSATRGAVALPCVDESADDSDMVNDSRDSDVAGGLSPLPRPPHVVMAQPVQRQPLPPQQPQRRVCEPQPPPPPDEPTSVMIAAAAGGGARAAVAGAPPAAAPQALSLHPQQQRHAAMQQAQQQQQAHQQHAHGAGGSGALPPSGSSGSLPQLLLQQPTPAATAAADAGNPFGALVASREVVAVGGRPYLKLECIGKGGSSRVYRVLGPDTLVYALKRVRLARMDAASVATYTNEIALLRRLNGGDGGGGGARGAGGGGAGRHIIKLVDAEVDYAARCIHIVMEYGQIDLNRLLVLERERVEREQGPSGIGAPLVGVAEPQGAAPAAAAASAGGAGVVRPCVDENTLRLVWQQMLTAVHAIHVAGVVPGDL